jgi:hypothetical protein
LANPDETAQGIFDLALELLAGSPAHHPSGGPPSP